MDLLGILSSFGACHACLGLYLRNAFTLVLKVEGAWDWWDRERGGMGKPVRLVKGEVVSRKTLGVIELDVRTTGACTDQCETA